MIGGTANQPPIWKTAAKPFQNLFIFGRYWITSDNGFLQSLNEFRLCVWSRCILLWMVVNYIKTIMAKLCIFILNNLMKNFFSSSDDKNLIHASHVACWNVGHPMSHYEHYILRLILNIDCFSCCNFRWLHAKNVFILNQSLDIVDILIFSYPRDLTSKNIRIVQWIVGNVCSNFVCMLWITVKAVFILQIKRNCPNTNPFSKLNQ